MKCLKLNAIAITCLISFAFFTSCKSDDDGRRNRSSAIEIGSSITVNNTFQSTTITNGNETAIEDLFNLPSNSLFSTANVGDAVEFPGYLLNLYDIDINEDSIIFEVSAQSDDPTYGDLFRTLEAGTFDRYYLTFSQDHNVDGFTSNNPSVNLRIDSQNVLVVEIGEGFNFQPNSTFIINLN